MIIVTRLFLTAIYAEVVCSGSESILRTLLYYCMTSSLSARFSHTVPESAWYTKTTLLYCIVCFLDALTCEERSGQMTYPLV